MCPQGKQLTYHVTDNGYETKRRVYGGASCQDCPVMVECTKSKNQRRLWVGVELLKLKKAAHDRLLSPKGIEARSSVFGRLKQNWGFSHAYR